MRMGQSRTATTTKNTQNLITKEKTTIFMFRWLLLASQCRHYHSAVCVCCMCVCQCGGSVHKCIQIHLALAYSAHTRDGTIARCHTVSSCSGDGSSLHPRHHKHKRRYVPAVKCMSEFRIYVLSIFVARIQHFVVDL